MRPRKIMVTLGLISTLTLTGAACSSGQEDTSATDATTSQGTSIAGADKTTITDWTDPRPAEWTTKYPLFGPVKTGDGSLAAAQQKGSIVVCQTLAFEPYGYKDPKTGEIKGFEVDIIRHLAKELGIEKVEYRNLDFSGLVLGVSSGQCDAAMTGLAYRTDRASAPGVKFTTPYVRLYDTVTVLKDSPIQTFEDLRGQTIASTTATTDAQIAQDYINQKIPGTKLRLFNTLNDCYLAVIQKHAQACFMEQASASIALKTHDSLRELDETFPYLATGSFAKDGTTNPYILGACGILTSAKAGDLNLALSVAIRDMSESGKLREILENWDLWKPEQLEMIRPDA